MWTIYRNDLSIDYIRSILDYNPETGVLTWRHRADYPKKWNTRYAGKPAGHRSNEKNPGYQLRIHHHDIFRAHRVAWAHFYGEWPEGMLDHINGDPYDNRIANLRPCTMSENGCNRGAAANNKSGYKGVFWCKQKRKWQAKIKVRGQSYHLGFHVDPAVAAAAYAEAAQRLHGEFARA